MDASTPRNDTWDIAGRTVVITGANSGIGLEAAVDLARRDARVVLTARDPDRGAAALDEVRRRSGSNTVDLVALDLGDLASVRDCAAGLLEAYDRLDVLVNNAGAMLSDRRTTVDGFEMTFGVNHLGHHLLTALLTERLVASAPARVVTVSSLAHRGALRGLDWDDLDRQRRYRAGQVYAESKLANLLFTTELARRLAGTGVTANACHPGSVRTGFGADGDTSGFERLALAAGRPFTVSPARGAEPIVHLAVAPELSGVTGEYFSGGLLPGVRRRPTTRFARDEHAARRLWELSDELAGINTDGDAPG